MIQELDESEVHYNNLKMKLAEVASLIKKITQNPKKLQKIKRNMLVHALQQEIESDEQSGISGVENRVRNNNNGKAKIYSSSSVCYLL